MKGDPNYILALQHARSHFILLHQLRRRQYGSKHEDKEQLRCSVSLPTSWDVAPIGSMFL